MSLAGALRIDIDLPPGALPVVRFDRPRPIPVERLFAGFTPAQATVRARLLFAICGNAHAVAMAMACEAAGQSQSPQSTHLARAILVCAEALREHAARILSDWPKLVGEEPDLAGLRSIVEAFRVVEGAVAGVTDEGYLVSGEQMEDVTAAAADLAATARSALLSDGQATPAARMIIARCGLDRAAEASGDAADGTVHGRWARDPRLEGNGVERRVRARLLEVEALCDWLSNVSTVCPLVLSAHAPDAGRGVAELDVARGRLVHEVRMDAGVIADYRISAPTMANFAPGGAAEAAIRALPRSDRADFDWLARLAILEVDPCVAHDVRIG